MTPWSHFEAKAAVYVRRARDRTAGKGRNDKKASKKVIRKRHWRGSSAFFHGTEELMALTKLMHMKQSGSRKPSRHLKNGIEYIMKENKTEGGQWIGGNAGSTPKEVYQTMLDTKEEYGKKSGRQGYHFVISFKKRMSPLKRCLRSCRNSARNTWGRTMTMCSPYTQTAPISMRTWSSIPFPGWPAWAAYYIFLLISIVDFVRNGRECD